jgi:hypothetical protein
MGLAPVAHVLFKLMVRQLPYLRREIANETEIQPQDQQKLDQQRSFRTLEW